MKHLSILILLAFFSSLLNASDYRSIRVGSFLNENDANKALIKLKKHLETKKSIAALQKKIHFEAKVVKVGKYYMNVVEPFRENKKNLIDVLNFIKIKYSYAYVKKIKTIKKIEEKKKAKNEEIIQIDLLRNKIPASPKQKVSIEISDIEIESIPSKILKIDEVSRSEKSSAIEIEKIVSTLKDENNTKIATEAKSNQKEVAVEKNTTLELETLVNKIKAEEIGSRNLLEVPKEKTIDVKNDLVVDSNNNETKEKLEAVVSKLKVEKVSVVENKTEEETVEQEITQTKVVPYDSLMIFQIVLVIVTIVLILTLGMLLRYKKKVQALLHEINDYDEKMSQLELEMANKEKFISQAGNDFKEPINTIVRLVKLISKGELSGSQKNQLNDVESSSNYMLRKIDDILDLIKIESKNLVLKKDKFNINQTIEDALEIVSNKARNNYIEIFVDMESKLPVNLIGDSQRLTQVIANILDNSVKFTKNGYINLSIEKVSNRKESISLEFSITDTGIGISKDDIDRIFFSYNQADRTIADEYGGLGLGLFISKEIIETMGGKISVDSKIDEGATFSFTLEFPLQDRLERRNYRLPSDAYLNKNVLVIESSEKRLSSLIKMIGYFRYEIDVIESFEESNIDLKDFYDIIIISKAKLNNIALENILQFKIKNNVKVVVLGDDINKIYSDKLEVDLFLNKPLTQHSIFNMIKNINLEKIKINIDETASKKEEFVSSTEEEYNGEDNVELEEKDNSELTIEKENKSTTDSLESSMEEVSDEVREKNDDIVETLSQEEEENELSVSVGMTNCADDRDLYESMLEEFVVTFVESAEVISKLCKSQEFKSARLYAIEIKDSSLNLGAYNLTESIAAIEYELEKESPENIYKLIDEYAKVLNKLIMDINNELRN